MISSIVCIHVSIITKRIVVYCRRISNILKQTYKACEISLIMEMEKHKIECADLKRCGEITTRLSVGKKEFFLNCIFCDYTFLQLGDFIQHICEDHMYQFTNPKLEEEVDYSLELNDDMDDGDAEILTTASNEDSEDSKANLRDFEKVEIKLDNNRIEDSIDFKELNLMEGYVSEDGEDSLSENDTEKNDDDGDEEGNSEIASYIQKLGLNEFFHKNIILAIFKGYENRPILWDNDIQITKDNRKREKEIKNIAEEVGIPNEWESIRKMFGKLSSRLRTELVRKKIYLSKGKIYTPAWYNDLTAFLKPKRQSAQVRPKPILRKFTNPESILDDRQSIILARIYNSLPTLWDETEITYRFSNRRRDALQKLLEDFNEETGLTITKYDLECEISRLRKLCSNEKRLKLACKRQNKIYKPSCSFYKHIKFLETDVSPFECSICEKVLSGTQQYKVHLASHDGSLPFKCHICGHGFKLVTNLTVHLRRHAQDYLYKCEVCDKPCATTTELRTHMRCHTGEKPYVCEICGKKYRSLAELRPHKLRHDKKPLYKCEICNKTFYMRSLMTEHMYVHSEVRDKVCNICEKGFTSNKHLRQHMLIHSSEKKYACKICGKRFAQYAGLSGHVKSHGTTLIEISSKSVKSKSEIKAPTLGITPNSQKMGMSESLLNDAQTVLLAEIYKEYTGLWDETDITYRFSNRRREALKAVHENFKNKSGLSLTEYDIGCEIARLRKICSHEKRLKILCKQQNKKHKPSCTFYEHISYLEVDVTPYECSICEKIISGVCQYKIHLASHDGSLPFKCHVCGHGFKLSTNLAVHLRRHVQDYLYKCEICSKPCATTTEIKIHMRSHTGEKPFVCEICGKSFRTSSRINTHKRRHENRPTHRCEICNKGFFSKSFYREHMNVHQNVRDKICNICNKGFTSAKHLRQHKQIHAAEKKYVCKICDKRFAQNAGLNGHMKSHGIIQVAANSEGVENVL